MVTFSGFAIPLFANSYEGVLANLKSRLVFRDGKIALQK